MRDVDSVDERRERDVLLADYLVPGLVEVSPVMKSRTPAPMNHQARGALGPVPVGAIGDGGHGREPEHGPGRDLAGPLHPGDDAEDPRFTRGDTEREVDERDDSLEHEEPHPGLRGCAGCQEARIAPGGCSARVVGRRQRGSARARLLIPLPSATHTRNLNVASRNFASQEIR